MILNLQKVNYNFINAKKIVIGKSQEINKSLKIKENKQSMENNYFENSKEDNEIEVKRNKTTKEIKRKKLFIINDINSKKENNDKNIYCDLKDKFSENEHIKKSIRKLSYSPFITKKSSNFEKELKINSKIISRTTSRTDIIKGITKQIFCCFGQK